VVLGSRVTGGVPTCSTDPVVRSRTIGARRPVTNPKSSRPLRPRRPLRCSLHKGLPTRSRFGQSTPDDFSLSSCKSSKGRAIFFQGSGYRAARGRRRASVPALPTGGRPPPCSEGASPAGGRRAQEHREASLPQRTDARPDRRRRAVDPLAPLSRSREAGASRPGGPRPDRERGAAHGREPRVPSGSRAAPGRGRRVSLPRDARLPASGRAGEGREWLASRSRETVSPLPPLRRPRATRCR